MATRDETGEYFEYALPGRCLAGSPREIVAQLDEVIAGLVALRKLIAERSSESTNGMRTGTPWINGVLRMLAVSGARPAKR